MIESLKKIYSLFPGKDRFKLMVLFGMMMFASVLEVLGIGIIPMFVVAVAKPENILQYPVVGDWLASAGINTSEELVVYGAILLIGVYIFKNVYLGYFLYIKKRFVANRGVYLEKRIFKAYMTSPYTFYISRNSAELLRNVTSETKNIVDGTLMPFMELALNVTMFVFILGSLLYFEPLITLVSIVLLGGGGGVFLRYTRRKTDQYGKEDRQARKLKNKAVLQGLGGFKDARVLNRESLFLKEYEKQAEISKLANIYKYVVGHISKPIIETLAVIGILLIALIMVWEGRAVSAIIPVLALFGAATVRLMPVFNLVITQVTSIRYNAFAVYAIYDDLMLLEGEHKEFRKEVLSKPSRVTLEQAINLKSISYQYPDSDEQAVDDVSVSIPKGSAVALVGHSGAGKTTLADVVLGLLEPRSGTIEVDGVDVFDNIRGWQQNIGYIPQSIYLLDETIRSNIALGIPDDEIDDEKLWGAIKAAQLEELIDRLPLRELTVVGERGIRLSGGQQQRIGIARALYNNPQVLIMDEATSALDNITEKFVIEAIEQLRGDRTIIMIAHRLTTVENCDAIYLMKDGRVVEQGTYSELIEGSKEFREMSLMD